MRYYLSMAAIPLSVTTAIACLFSGCDDTKKPIVESQIPQPVAKAAAPDEASQKRVELETTMGKIVIELDEKAAPVTVENFLRYIEQGFYNETIFHRVIANFMIQGGGMTTQMSQKQTLPPIVNEANNGLKNKRGTVAMARTNNPNSASSQFFVNLKDNAFLDYSGPRNPGYTVFGSVVEGMDVVDSIAAVKTTTTGGHQDVPAEPVIIKSVRLVTSP